MYKYVKIEKICFYPFLTGTSLIIEKLFTPSNRARQAAQLWLETFFYVTLGLAAIII